MKNPITFSIALLISILSFAQQGINYKALIKDDLGNVLANTNLTVQFTIHENTETGTVVYREDHSVTTDAKGILILNIGTDETPIQGSFSNVNWGEHRHYLQTSIGYSEGFIHFDATEFMAIPYAKHAETAGNIFSGDYNDLSNQPASPSGLEHITENSKTGWRFINAWAHGHGEIGSHAVDLSKQQHSSNENGATGFASFAAGLETKASGDFSIAMGRDTDASGEYSVAIGLGNYASGDYATAMGRYTNATSHNSTALGNNTTALGGNSTSMGIHTTATAYASTAIGKFSITDSNGLFIVGNGISTAYRNNAFIIKTDGKVGVNTTNPESLLEITHANSQPTTTNLTNAFSIRNTVGESWQFYTQFNGNLHLYNNGTYRGAFLASSGAYLQTSDRKLKKDIKPLENNTLNKVMQLNPVTYLMKEQTDTKRNLGLISQEVQELFPSITHYVKESDLLTLSYTELIPILIKALQEQQTIINEHKTEIDNISADNSSLVNTVNDLISRVEKIETNNQ